MGGQNSLLEKNKDASQTNQLYAASNFRGLLVDTAGSPHDCFCFFHRPFRHVAIMVLRSQNFSNMGKVRQESQDLEDPFECARALILGW